MSGLATRAGRQMNKWNYNIANTLGFLFMCHLLEREVRLISALCSHLYLTDSLFFIPETYSHCFLTCVYLSTYLLMYCFSGFISSLRIQSKYNSVEKSPYVKNIHIEESTKICLEIIIWVFHHTVQGINQERLTTVFKNLWQNNKDFFLNEEWKLTAIFEFEKHNSFFLKCLLYYFITEETYNLLWQKELQINTGIY